MTNQNNILTEEEIKELISSLNRNPNEAEIRAVIDYFWLRPYALKHLKDKEFRKSFVCLIYIHHDALYWYIKADKEVKSLQSLTTNLMANCYNHKLLRNMTLILRCSVCWCLNKYMSMSWC